MSSISFKAPHIINYLQGEGKCPFGNKCFYKHAGADGVLIDVGCPRRARKIQVNEELIDLLDVSIIFRIKYTVFLYITVFYILLK